MSTIPKARYCQIVDLAVTPEKWDSYPTLDRTHINQCSFSGLTESTYVERSRLTRTHLHSDGSGKSRIDRSTLTDCNVQQVVSDRCEVESSFLKDVRIERSKISGATLSGPNLKIERSELENCDVKGYGKVERSGIKVSLVEDSKVARSNVTSSFLTNTTIERGNVDGCDIGNCKIQRTKFQDMYLRNGIWERDNLVGRVDKTKEVIIKRADEMLTERDMGYSLPASSAGQPGPSWNPDIKTNSQVTPKTDTREEMANPINDDYDGPDSESPPPYDEINARAGLS